MISLEQPVEKALFKALKECELLSLSRFFLSFDCLMNLMEMRGYILRHLASHILGYWDNVMDSSLCIFSMLLPFTILWMKYTYWPDVKTLSICLHMYVKQWQRKINRTLISMIARQIETQILNKQTLVFNLLKNIVMPLVNKKKINSYP